MDLHFLVDIADPENVDEIPWNKDEKSLLERTKLEPQNAGAKEKKKHHTNRVEWSCWVPTRQEMRRGQRKGNSFLMGIPASILE